MRGDMVDNGDGTLLKDRGGVAIDRVARAVDKTFVEVRSERAPSSVERILPTKKPATPEYSSVSVVRHCFTLSREASIIAASVVSNRQVCCHEIFRTYRQRGSACKASGDRARPASKFACSDSSCPRPHCRYAGTRNTTTRWLRFSVTPQACLKVTETDMRIHHIDLRLDHNMRVMPDASKQSL